LSPNGTGRPKGPRGTNTWYQTTPRPIGRTEETRKRVVQLEAHAPSVPPSDIDPPLCPTEDSALIPLTQLTALDEAIENLGAPVPCRAYDPEVFFAESPADVEYAKSLCRTCPLVEACLAGAKERREPWGVWGGELFVQGVVVARKRPRGRPRKNPVAA
jgi:WhiB family transcriptional regulator, redox-sensing transcriptional regulator